MSPLEEHADRLLVMIADHPDLTLDKLVTVMRKRKIAGSRSALSRFFIVSGISLPPCCRRAGEQYAFRHEESGSQHDLGRC
jgi:hypothetical protein